MFRARAVMATPTPPTTPKDDENVGDGGAGGAGKKGSGEDEILAGWYRMAGVGIEFVVAVALFAGIGYAIDRWRGTGPWGVLIGLGLGFAVGLRAMIRVAKRSFKQ
jgi:ATP synthase protein I